MNKNILFITDTLAAGGVEQQLSLLAGELQNRGYKPHILCLYGERAGRSSHFLPILEKQGIPVRVLDLGYSPVDKLRAIVAIVQEVWKIQPSIVHAMNYHSNLLSRMARAFFPPKTKLVGAILNDYSPHQWGLERLTWRMCSAIVCISPHLEEKLVREIGMPAARVVTIRNGLDTARFAAIPAELPEKGDITLVMIGRISRQKSPQLLALALALLKHEGVVPANLRVYIVGERDKHPLHDVQVLLDKAIEDNDLENIIQQHPPTNKPEIYYHAADISILPSLYEGLPNVMLESLAAGKPVLISEAANKAGVIEEGKTGWIVRTNDIAHLAQKLKEVFALPQAEIAAMEEACKSKAAEFSIERMLAQHIELYESLP